MVDENTRAFDEDDSGWSLVETTSNRIRFTVHDEWDEVMVIMSREGARALAADLAAIAGPGRKSEQEDEA